MPGERAALYLRLSREDGDRDVSESIENQRSFLCTYADEHAITVFDVYIDDGYSGVNFERPGFKRLINDIESGRVNTVITKDLSRLGRDYILTGHYIERFFPSHNVRYIAVNDNVDSDTGPNDMAPIRSIFNDYYARDISKKVRTALNTKKTHGAFIGSVPPYGYKKDPGNKNRLIADELTAPYVQRIYSLYLSGMNVVAIANQLTNEGVPTPSESKNLTATQRRFPGLWNDRIVRRILENPVYIGHMTQNKTEKKSYKLDKRITLPRDKWIIVENTHEAIISRGDFRAVQEMITVRRYSNGNRNTGGAEHLLTGLVFCADCGAPMATIKEAQTRYYLVCRTWRRHAGLKLCTSHCIREDLVIDEVKTQLRTLAQQFIDSKTLADDCEPLLKGIHKTEGLQKALEKQFQDKQRIKLALYKDKAAGVISEADYIAFSGEITKEETQITAQLEALRGYSRDDDNVPDAQIAVDSLLSFDNLDRKILLSLLRRIEIGLEKQILIVFNFSDPE